MRDLHSFTDIHRHNLADADPETTVINLMPGQYPDKGWYSVGIHPWFAENGKEQYDWLEKVAGSDRVVAIGECGFDKLRGPDMETQLQIFEYQTALSERVGKPLIIHNVKSTAELIAERKKLQPRQPWIIHGFRGKPQQARELLKHGFSLSFGSKYNEESYALTPAEKRYCETDI